MCICFPVCTCVVEERVHNKESDDVVERVRLSEFEEHESAQQSVRITMCLSTVHVLDPSQVGVLKCM
jgi:hypothetical protein